MHIRRPARCFLLTLAFAGPVLAHPGIGIVLDAQGNVFYTDLERVWRIDPAGRKSVAVPGVHTHELALDADGNLYGEHLWYEGEKTDRWRHRVWRRSAEGRIEDALPAREGFLRDYSFVRDPSGTMFWVDRGAATVFWRKAPSGKAVEIARCGDCREVRWLATAGDGALLFIDGGDLRSLSSGGVVRTLAKGLQKSRNAQLLMGIWTDGRKGIFVADYGHREVKRIDAGGQVRVVARSRLPWGPTGGLVAPDGSLWILEGSVTHDVRVRRIAPGGRETIY